MGWEKRNKSKSALGKISQANAMIESLKNTTIGGIAESVNTLASNYILLNELVNTLSNTISTIQTNIEGLNNSSSLNEEAMVTINEAITILNQKVAALEAI